MLKVVEWKHFNRISSNVRIRKYYDVYGKAIEVKR